MRKNLVGFDTSLLDVMNHANNSSHDSMPHWCHRYDTPGYDATNHARVTFLQDSMPQIIMYQMVRSADTIRLDDALLKAAKISNFRFSTLARIRRIF